jgi:murein DD-endopeptidase MepM/ murein hydrolase activator NlpD
MFLSPIPGIVRITQKFGLNRPRYAPFGLNGHNGIDFGVPVGTPIHSPVEGIVTVVGDQGKEGYGKYVRIVTGALDAKGRYKEITLAHLSEQYVKVGDIVYQLDPIGLSGNTGFSTGPHLHSGLRFLNVNKQYIDYNNGFKGAVDYLQYLRAWALPEQKEAYFVIV